MGGECDWWDIPVQAAVDGRFIMHCTFQVCKHSWVRIGLLFPAAFGARRTDVSVSSARGSENGNAYLQQSSGSITGESVVGERVPLD